MNLKLSIGLFSILLLISSCEKEFNDLGASLLPSDTFVIEKETAPVRAEHKSIEVVRTDNLSFFSLGEYEDAVFGNTKASFTTQLSLATSSTGTFGSMSPDTETNGVIQTRPTRTHMMSKKQSQKCGWKYHSTPINAIVMVMA